MLMAEGGLMALCLVPAWHFADGTQGPIAVSAGFTLAVGCLMWYRHQHDTVIEDRRMSYLLVVLLWVLLSLFATLPFMTTGATTNFTNAWFESMSGVTSTGATIFPAVSSLPSSVLLWRSMTQWFGGFGQRLQEPTTPARPPCAPSSPCVAPWLSIWLSRWPLS